ncbi:penicillin-binding protein [Bacillus sp. 3103sda1]|uniref:penicillin-binding protein n=1 Tax=Bacillus sp. 3103sda1 TaxID=2953808 RepID=UPI002646D056
MVYINKHRKCVCEQLEELQVGTEVDIFLNGNFIDDVTFVNFNPENFCATFVFTEGPEAGGVLLVDCRDIQALTIEAS